MRCVCMDFGLHWVLGCSEVVPGIYTICGIYSILMTDRYYTEGKQNILHVHALFLLVQNWVGDMIGGAVFPA